jgi:hypothetical protein
MPIVASDILLKLSVSAAAGNTTGGTPATSLGDQISTTVLSGTALNNLFDDVSGAESTAGRLEYRCVFAHNSHPTLTMTNAVVWLSAEAGGGASAAVGADTTAISAIGSASAQALTVANESTAPAGVSFSSPTTSAAGVALGSIAPGQCKAFWVRRTVAAATAAMNNDTVDIAVTCETAA